MHSGRPPTAHGTRNQCCCSQWGRWRESESLRLPGPKKVEQPLMTRSTRRARPPSGPEEAQTAAPMWVNKELTTSTMWDVVLKKQNKTKTQTRKHYSCAPLLNNQRIFKSAKLKIQVRPLVISGFTASWSARKEGGIISFGEVSSFGK